MDGKQETTNPLNNNEERKQNRTSSTVIGIDRDEAINYKSRSQIQCVNHSNQQRTPHIPYLSQRVLNVYSHQCASGFRDWKHCQKGQFSTFRRLPSHLASTSEIGIITEY